MTMGVSSIQPTPLRPCCPSYFTLLQSSPRYSTMGFSYRSFSASSKALHRQETCTVWSFSQNITIPNTSIQFRQDIFYHNNSLVEAKPLSGGSLSSSFKPLGCQAWVVEAERLRHSKKECIFSQSKGLVGSKTSSIMNIRKDTKQELQSLPDGRDGAKSESYTTNFEDTLSRTQTSKSPDQPYIQDQMFAQSGKYDVDAQNVGSYMMPYGHNRNVYVKKVNSHRIDGSEKLNLFPVQCSEKAVKCNGMVSNMEVKSNTGSERRIHEVSETNGRDIGITYFKFTNLSGESEITQEDPNAECAMIRSDQGGTYRKPSLFQTRDTWSRTQARMAQPQPHMQDQIFLQNGKKVNGHMIYGSDKLVLSSAQRLKKAVKSNETISEKSTEFRTKTEYVPSTVEASEVISRDIKGKKSLKNPNGSGASDMTQADLCARLGSIYSEILVVDSVSVAKDVVRLLTGRYRHLVHACDTEVAKIDVKKETPVDHGEIICFSIYSGPEADYGNGKSCLWVDVLDGGGRELLLLFAPFFEDPSIKKVWHNYSFDNHVVENYGLKLSGFHADTMHMARLWDSSRRAKGGYSLEALTGDPKIMSGAKLCKEKNLFGKISMKTIFGRKKMKKDGNEGKIIGIAPVEELQREERIPWICYSALDAISTLKLYESLKNQLSNKPWQIDGNLAPGKSMFDFYEKYWQPFGEILVKMETEGMLVDRAYLAEIEKCAKVEQEIACNRFRKWASKYCADAMYMNVGSDAQLRQLLFGGAMNRKDQNKSLPLERKFKIPNVDKVIEEGKKVPAKYRNMTLNSIGVNLKAEMYTETGWPSVSGDAMKMLAGKVASEFDFLEDAESDDDIGDNPGEITAGILEEKPNKPEHIDKSSYGTAFEAFENPEDGREACHAIAALCQMCSIDTLISNFIMPLQSSNISGRNGRIHCSLNINTETGRLSARRPNLQNQPALEKDRYKIRQAFIAAPGNSLIVADYGQLELRILAHLTNCKSMLDAFKVGGDFHSRTALNMYPHIREAIEKKQVLLEWDPQPGEDKPPAPLLKDVFATERKKAKQLNFSIAYGKTPVGLAHDWKVSVEEARKTVELWYNERKEVLTWQEQRKEEAHRVGCVCTLLGRARWFPSLNRANRSQIGHVERAAINTPVQGSAADVAMCAMLEISNNARLKELGWRLLLQVHDEVILEGPSESGEIAKNIVVDCMSKPFDGKNFLNVDLVVDAKCAQNWYAAK